MSSRLWGRHRSIEADDLVGALEALQSAAKSMEMSPALDGSAMATYAYIAL